MYRIGSRLSAGVLDEAAGRGSSGGVELVGERLVEQALLLEIGRQLGEGLSHSATDLTPEQRESLATAIEGLMMVTTSSFGAGLRDDVSPELREMVRVDIVQPLADGMRGPFSDALTFSVERAIATAESSAKDAVSDPELREAIAELIRSAVYEAMVEGRPGSPGVGETLEQTLTYNLLAPFEESIKSITQTVASRVDESADRTEGTLRAVIKALAVVLGLFVLMYALTRRQLLRARESSQAAEVDLRSISAALSMLDEETRTRIIRQAGEYHSVAAGAATAAATPPPARARSDAYLRKPPGEDPPQ
jgi:hypothetical protein